MDIGFFFGGGGHSPGFFRKVFLKSLTHTPVNLKVILQIMTMTTMHTLATSLSWMFNLNLQLSEVNLRNSISVRTVILKSYYSPCEVSWPKPYGKDRGPGNL